MNRVGGIVLCGGKSSRMGRAKAWLPFGDEFMLQRVVRTLSRAVSPIVVVAAPDQEVPPLPEAVILARDPEEFRGPLQGLAVGLTVLRAEVHAAYLSACDVPFLKAEFVRRMASLLGEKLICVPHAGGFHHPLAAVYHVDILPHVAELLQQYRLRPVFLFDAVPTRVVEEAEMKDVDPTLESLRNLNTPAEYEAALRERERRASE